MRKTVRFRITLLALMLAVSHAALIAHVTAHFAPDLEQCQLCVSQAQMSSAIPASDLGCPVDAGLAAPLCSEVHGAVCLSAEKAFHQRAPPLPSA
jgi:hypothetical protein